MDKEISRRQFLLGVGAGLVSLGLAGCGIKPTEPSASSSRTARPSASKAKTTSPSGTPGEASSTPSSTPIGSGLIVAEGGGAESIIQRGLDALGGLGQFVAPGSTVVIKPNFSVPRKPEEAATTDPELVAELVKQCLSAGAKEVKVLDFPFSSPICLTKSGIKDAVEAVGGNAFIINKKSFYQAVDTGGEILKKILYSKDVLEADVLIGFPKLKHHHTTKLTMGLKNLMGVVWDRGYFHSTDLHQTIAELAAFHKPNLTILDATRGITTNGPTGPGKIKEWEQVVFGIDPVAVDAYGANLFGVDPNDIEYIKKAAALGVGEMDLNKIKITKV